MDHSKFIPEWRDICLTISCLTISFGTSTTGMACTGMDTPLGPGDDIGLGGGAWIGGGDLNAS